MKSGVFFLAFLSITVLASGEEIVVHTRSVETTPSVTHQLVGHHPSTGHHLNSGVNGFYPTMTHVPTTSALPGSFPGWGGMPGMGGTPLFPQMAGGMSGFGTMDLMPMTQPMAWGSMPSMMMPMDMGGMGLQPGVMAPVIASEMPPLTGMPLIAAEPLVSVPIPMQSTSIMAQAMGVWSPVSAGMTELQSVSMFAVTPVEPRLFHIHDLVQIIVRESSVAASFQGLETEKEYGLAGGVESFPGVNGQNPLYYTEFDVVGEKEFDGEGEYVREDELVTRLSAEIIEIRPNGSLVLEARTRIRTDDEEWYTQLTGICRPEDITAANTILSNQIFDLQVEKRHKGDVPQAASKGILAQALDVIFAF
ncbi:MAG: flagellar basal body L-ring protein FlgH [Phycisphaerales bacterium]|nr:flagellar basal body L-ring protein FlgH [Phycisphaerales bacterium]